MDEETEYVSNAQEYLTVENMQFMVRAARKHPTRDNIIVIYKCRTQEGKDREVALVLLIEYEGYAKERAQAWFSRRGLQMPSTARYALNMAKRAVRPEAILVRKNGQWDEIVMEYFTGEEGVE